MNTKIGIKPKFSKIKGYAEMCPAREGGAQQSATEFESFMCLE